MSVASIAGVLFLLVRAVLFLLAVSALVMLNIYLWRRLKEDRGPATEVRRRPPER